MDRTTPLKSAGGYSGTLTNVFIGPLKSVVPLVNCFRDTSIDSSGVEINIGVYRNGVRFLFSDGALRLCDVRKRGAKEKAQDQGSRDSFSNYPPVTSMHAGFGGFSS